VRVAVHVDRDTLIRQHLYARGQSTIQELAGIADASIATIRRDLQRLEEKGVIERTHGGARIAGSVGVEVAFEAREQHCLDAKRAIAELAYGMLRPRSSVFLDAGTTVLQLARHVRLAPMPLAVFTNSLAVAQMLLGLPEVQVTMLGGQLRPENLSAVGPIAERSINDLWFDQLFIGASAIQARGTPVSIDLATIDGAEASRNACMLRRATQTCVLADASKFGLTATYHVAPLAAVTDLVTDQEISSEWQAWLSELRLRLSIADLLPSGADV
jgi:DeoR/GlpR family transcriptional regulator of sugar metabolism